MPNYRVHLMGGIASYGIVVLILLSFLRTQISLLSCTEWFFCSLAGSLFPDIDIKSRGQKYFYWIMLCIVSFLVVKQDFVLLSFFSIVSLFPLLVSHRGIIHRVRFIVGIPLAAWLMISFFTPALYYPLLYNTIFFIAGAYSHLLLDFGPRRLWRKL